MELHHPIMSKLRDLGGQIYRIDRTCGIIVLDKLDVTYQSAFAASEKTAPSAPPLEWDA